MSDITVTIFICIPYLLPRRSSRKEGSYTYDLYAAETAHLEKLQKRSRPYELLRSPHIAGNCQSNHLQVPLEKLLYACVLGGDETELVLLSKRWACVRHRDITSGPSVRQPACLFVARPLLLRAFATFYSTFDTSQTTAGFVECIDSS